MRERQLKRYLRQARQHLYCADEDRDLFEQQIRTAAAEIEREQPDATWEDCVRILGTPQQAADEYMQDFPPDSVNFFKRQRHLRYCTAIAGLAAAIALLFALVCYGWFVKEFTVTPLLVRVSAPFFHLASHLKL